MRTLTVLYDGNCRLCQRIKIWLQAQPKFIHMDFVAANSVEAKTRFPHLDHAASVKELFVVTDEGNFYRDTKAWLMCLYALREYRGWAFRFSTPELMPLARRFVVNISSLRFKFGYRTS